MGLPRGYRFELYDNEVISYLEKKLNKERLPCDNVRDINVYDHTPEELYYGMSTYLEEGVLYCFTPRFRNTARDDRPNRSVKKNDGNWRKTTGQIKIYDRYNEHIGFRTTLVYWRRTGNEVKKTSWIMQEYTLSTQTPLHDKQNELKLDEWVLCKIYIATKGSKSNVEERYHPYAGKNKSSSKGSSSSNDTESSDVNNISMEQQQENVNQNPLPVSTSPCLNNHLQNIEEELFGSSQNISQSPIGMEVNYSSVDQQNIYDEYEQLLEGQFPQHDWSQMYLEPQWQVPFPQENTQAKENQDMEDNALDTMSSSKDIEFLNDIHVPSTPFIEHFPQENTQHTAVSSEQIEFFKKMDWKTMSLS